MSRAIKYALVAILAAATVTGVSYFDSRYQEAKVVDVQTRFQLLGSLRRSALETYLTTARAELSFWSLSERIHDSALALRHGWSELGDDARSRLRDLYIVEKTDIRIASAISDADDGSNYSKAHADLHPLAREFVSGRGYYDFFLIDLDGNVIYSVEKEDDFATNLRSGSYDESGLASVFPQLTHEQAGDEVIVSDLARYAPSDDEPAIALHVGDGSIRRNVFGRRRSPHAKRLTFFREFNDSRNDGQHGNRPPGVERRKRDRFHD
jgi:methyl-accepting chemotaxis protein